MALNNDWNYTGIGKYTKVPARSGVDMPGYIRRSGSIAP